MEWLLIMAVAQIDSLSLNVIKKTKGGGRIRTPHITEVPECGTNSTHLQQKMRLDEKPSGVGEKTNSPSRSGSELR